MKRLCDPVYDIELSKEARNAKLQNILEADKAGINQNLATMDWINF